MSTVFILIEQALGYCLLKVKNCTSVDELVLLLQDKNLQKTKDKITLAEFQPFSSVNNASFNCQDIANGNASEDLLQLLRRHLSVGRCILVVSDRKLLESLKAANINEKLEFNADSAMVINLRRVRHLIHEFMDDKEQHLIRAHIGLGHSFSRMKIKFNVNRADNMIIQSINLLDQLDKDINTMSMRLREWFGYHYPELIKLVGDNRAYSNVVKLIGSRAGAVDGVLDRLEEIVGDSARAKQIIITARTSMGYELTEEDLFNIGHLASKILSMMTQREDTAKYLSSKMGQVAPNFSTLVGDIVAARLISHAGSLINLAKFPASTIQILGAEKALFRALKTRTNTPKYGLIFHSSFIGRAAKQDKGRISRFLAAKISLAVRLDCFMEEPMNIFGLHLKKQVEDQLKYLETGEEPKKNFEAMEEAVIDAKRYVAELKITRNIEQAKLDNLEKAKESEVVVEASKGKKKKNKKNKSLITDIENVSNLTDDLKRKDAEEMIVNDAEEVSEKKKKSKKKEAVVINDTVVPAENKIEEISKKKKRKSEKKETESILNIEDKKEEMSIDVEVKKDKKRKSANTIGEEAIQNHEKKVETTVEINSTEKSIDVEMKKVKKDKKRKSTDVIVEEAVQNNEKRKKSKKVEAAVEINATEKKKRKMKE